MSFTYADTDNPYQDHSALSMIEVLGLMVFTIFFIVPLIFYIMRKYEARRNRIASTPIRDFIVGTVLMTQQELDERKLFLERNLTTCKVIANDDKHERNVDEEKGTMEVSKVHNKGDLRLPPSTRKDTKESADEDADDCDSPPMCAICVAEYESGDEICWSNHHQCHHCFHKACIQEWLLLHEDCPCCRLAFLGTEKYIREGVVDEEVVEDTSNAENSISSEEV